MIKSEQFLLIMNDSLGAAAVGGALENLMPNAGFIDDVKRHMDARRKSACRRNRAFAGQKAPAQA